jgi:hypothetical protein
MQYIEIGHYKQCRFHMYLNALYIYIQHLHLDI